jgi:hypothetical protein
LIFRVLLRGKLQSLLIPRNWPDTTKKVPKAKRIILDSMKEHLLPHINTKFSFVNLSVRFQHDFVNIIWGEHSVTKFTIRHQWFARTLPLFQPYLIPKLYCMSFWKYSDQCFRGIAIMFVPKPFFSLETLTTHCLLLFGCMYAGFLMRLCLGFIYLIIKACGHRSEDAS